MPRKEVAAHFKTHYILMFWNGDNTVLSIHVVAAAAADDDDDDDDDDVFAS